MFYNTAIKILTILIHPFSPITTIVISFFITLLATGDNIPNFIQLLIDNKIILAVCLTFWLLFSIFYTYMTQKLDEKDNKIKNLTVQLQEKDNQIQQNSGVILHKYGELAKFNKKNRFYDCLRSFVDNNIGVECAQIYKYSTTFRNSSLKIKLSYEEGFSSEDIDINVLFQSYYLVENEIYKELKSINTLWNKLYNNEQLGLVEEEILTNSLFNKIESLLVRLVNGLNTIKDSSEIKEYHYVHYQIVLLLISIFNTSDEIRNYDSILQSEAIENEIKYGKRTGILGAILSENLYTFKHTGRTRKNGRTYICFPFEAYNEQYVVLIVISPDSITNRFNQFLVNLKYDFIVRLSHTN